MRKYRKFILFIGIIAFLVISYLIADNFLFDGIRPKPIHQNGFQANYYSKDELNKKPVVILIGGGQWGNYWAQEFANNDMVGLSLPYIGKEGLPKLPENINLEYFENAIKWLEKQKEVDSNKIIVMGASRNAELALIIASIFPNKVNGVIAYAPSAVSWPNTVLPYNSDELKASWVYKGYDIPYIPMDKIPGNNSDKINLLEYWEDGLSNKTFVDKALINVEKIKGPILLFSGIDDKVWPSAKMANMIEKRLKENNFKYSFKNIQYENAGHQISGNPEQNSNLRFGNINIEGKNYEYEFGGTEDGDIKAKKNAYQQTFEFLSNLNNE